MKTTRALTKWLYSYEYHLKVAARIDSIPANYVDRIIELVRHLAYHKGKKGAIAQLKLYKNFVNRKVMGITPEPLPFTKVTRTGFPKVLIPWKDLILSSTIQDKRRVNTLFGSVNLLK